MSKAHKPVILILAPIAAKGGISSVINSILEQDINTKFDFIKINTSLYKDGGIVRELITFLKAILKYIFILIFKRVDLIHIHTSASVSFYRKSIFALIGILFQRNIIYHLHSSRFYDFFYNPPNQLLKSYIKRIFKSATCVICLCENWKDCLKERYHLKNITVIPNPVCQVPFANKSFSMDVSRLLFVGFYINSKGIIDLLEVCKDLHLKGVNFTLELCGKGEMNEIINSYIMENSLEKCIINNGWVEGRAKENIFRKADIFVLPSYAEGMPISILEAFSYGLPIVATKISCVPAIVEDGINGFLIEPGNRKELLEKISVLINNKYLRESMSKNNLLKVKHYSPEVIAGRWENLYKDLLK
ncbi:MAG: glycosyltransferase family 4 protein [Nitrospirae bacterium]|nr:glycosyltransferase family 4 protein [Nitrospirota bacterium]